MRGAVGGGAGGESVGVLRGRRPASRGSDGAVIAEIEVGGSEEVRAAALAGEVGQGEPVDLVGLAAGDVAPSFFGAAGDNSLPRLAKREPRSDVVGLGLVHGRRE